MQYLSARRHRDADYIALSLLSCSRRYINFAEALKKVHVYQNANYGGRRSFFRLLVANYRSIPDGRTRASVTIGHDRVDIARNDFLSFPPSPLLEKPFVSAYSFTVLWFYHLNSASSDLFQYSPLPPPSPSLSHPICLSPSPFFPLASPFDPHTVARDTT